MWPADSSRKGLLTSRGPRANTRIGQTWLRHAAHAQFWAGQGAKANHLARRRRAIGSVGTMTARFQYDTLRARAPAEYLFELRISAVLRPETGAPPIVVSRRIEPLECTADAVVSLGRSRMEQAPFAGRFCYLDPSRRYYVVNLVYDATADGFVARGSARLPMDGIPRSAAK
jgi:hypothetical protein